jgi:hypothetical protein
MGQQLAILLIGLLAIFPAKASGNSVTHCSLDQIRDDFENACDYITEDISNHDDHVHSLDGESGKPIVTNDEIISDK